METRHVPSKTCKKSNNDTKNLESLAHLLAFAPPVLYCYSLFGLSVLAKKANRGTMSERRVHDRNHSAPKISKIDVALTSPPRWWWWSQAFDLTLCPAWPLSPSTPSGTSWECLSACGGRVKGGGKRREVGRVRTTHHYLSRTASQAVALPLPSSSCCCCCPGRSSMKRPLPHLLHRLRKMPVVSMERRGKAH